MSRCAPKSEEFVRLVRTVYVHEACGRPTTMDRVIAEAFARDPSFYDSAYCCYCQTHRPVGVTGEFVWLDRSRMGT